MSEKEKWFWKDGRFDDDSRSTVSSDDSTSTSEYGFVSDDGSEIVTMEQLLDAISKQRAEDKAEARAESKRVRAEVRAEARADREAFLEQLRDLMNSYRE